MKIHKLKLNHIYYRLSETNTKSFEIRKNDRDFKIGDILELWDYDLERNRYYGRYHWKMITYILDNEEFLQPGYVCLSVVPITGSVIRAFKLKNSTSEKEEANEDD